MTPSPTAPMPTASADALLFDAEALLALVGDALYSQGLADFKAHRVTELALHEEVLTGTVEDADSGEPVSLQVEIDPTLADRLRCDCDCAAPQCCRHAVALLCRYSAEAGRSDSLSARAAALDERLQKARSEVRVEPPGKGACLGIWKAIAVAGASHFPRRYEVHIRVLQGPGNYCSCPDFAVNRLGTCKHVEAVLHKIHKQPALLRRAQQAPARSYVYLHWDDNGDAGIRLHRGSDLPAATSADLASWFDTEGRFRGRLPDAFFEFCERFGDRGVLDIGEDARRHAQRLGNQAVQQRRADTLRESIRSSAGVLPGLHARLFPYQVEGVAFLAANGRAMLADDMGLGKTLQAIAAASWLQRHEGVGRVLIVCPTSLKHQWAREIERFTGMQSQIIGGGIDQRNVQYRRPADFHIVNYELLLRDLGAIQRELKPDLLILDEAQRIKNWRTKTAAAVKRIDTRYAFVLSGTPLENRLEDLYSLMQVVDDQILGPLWRYQIDFQVCDERGKVIGYRNLSELRRRIAPSMLRRSRLLVADQLPARIEKLLEVPMSPEQLQAHDAALSRAQRLANIARRRPLTPGEQNQLMAALQTARMACNALGLLDGETEGSPKLDELSNLLEQHCLDGGQKIVVFSQWERMTRLAETCARRLGLGVARLHGGVPGNQRGELIRRFHDDDSLQVFISTDAGATGLNLQVASVLVNLDIPWNPALLDQRIARIHRLGQHRPVFIVNMVAFEGYEARVLQLVNSKRTLFDNVVDPEAQEDVVGVSRQALDSILGSLDAGEVEFAAVDDHAAAVGDDSSAVETAVATPLAEASGEHRALAGDAADPAIAAAIRALQHCFGRRLEQVLGSAGGLLGILTEYRDGDEDAAAAIVAELAVEGVAGNVSPGTGGTDPLAVGVIDRRGWQALQRLGKAWPLATARAIALPEAAAKPSIPPLLRLAQEKLAAAETLARAEQRAASAELAAAALRSAAALRGGLNHPPAAGQLALWLYGEAVPRGCVSAEEAAAVLRAEALSQAGEIPESLLQQLLDDARQALSRATLGATGA